MSEPERAVGPFDAEPDNGKKKFARTALLILSIGLLGIGASVGAVYFFSSDRDFGADLRASVGNLVTVRDDDAPASRLSRRSAGVTPEPTPSTRMPQADSNAESSAPVFDTILISEIQIAGEAAGDEFIELYNPNDFNVPLDGWSVKRKTASGKEYSLAAAKLFEGKEIPAHGYFLAAHTGAVVGVVPDLWWASSNAIASDNTVILYGKNGDETVIVDLVGFGDVSVFEGAPPPNPALGQTLSRSSEEDSDNNQRDFILSVPSPRNSNSGTGFVRPAAVSSPSPSPNPSPSPSPTPPRPSPTPSPSPSPTLPTPSPSLSPTFEPSPSPSPVALMSIRINELQISGISSATDEFIELYNPNDIAVDLGGWALKKKTASGNESNLVSSQAFTGMIPGHGFFLIAHQIGYTGGASPDVRYSGATYSVAADNTVLLYDAAGQVVDRIGFGGATDFEMAPTGNPAASQSIERQNFQDTDNNAADFIIREASTPQNSRSP